GNSLHIQTNDNSSTTLISFKLQGTEKNRIWASAMKLALQAINKFSFVDDTCLKIGYSTSDVLSAQWDRCNVIVLTWIMNSVSQDVYMGLVYPDNVVYVWKELEIDYYHRLNSLLREFDALTKLPKFIYEVKCSCAASSELVLHQQLMKLMQFLMSLDDCYQPIRSALLTRDPLPEVKDAYITVPIEESHRGILESSDVSESKLNATFFATKSFNDNRRNFNNNKGFTSNNNVNRGPNPRIQRISLTGFPAQSVRSSNPRALDSPYLLVLITKTSQSRQHESRKLPTVELFEVDSGRISIRHCEY
ncbi:ribonuclease H-like domain-containing protein, partial [Tanacetum coccineum]